MRRDLVHAAAEVGVAPLDVVAVARDECLTRDVGANDAHVETEPGATSSIAVGERLGE